MMRSSDSRWQASKQGLRPIKEEQTPRTQQASVGRLRHDTSTKGKGHGSRQELHSNATQTAYVDAIVDDGEVLRLNSQSSSNGQEYRSVAGQAGQQSESQENSNLGGLERLEVDDMALYKNSRLRSTVQLVEKHEESGHPTDPTNKTDTAGCMPSDPQIGTDGQSLADKKQNLNQQSEGNKQGSESGSERNSEFNKLNIEQHKPNQEESNSDAKQDGLIHRLPQNYFMEEDDDEEDMEQVISNIQNMRNQMLSYVNESQIDKELNREMNDIANIIEPGRFIERHYGEKMTDEAVAKEGPTNRAQSRIEESQDAGPPKFLFEELLKDTPTANLGKQLHEHKTEQAFLSTFKEESEPNPAHKVATDEATTEDRAITTRIEEEKSKQQPIVDFWGNDDEEQNNVDQQQEYGNEEAAIDEPVMYGYQEDGQVESQNSINIEDGQAQEYVEAELTGDLIQQDQAGATTKAVKTGKSPGPRLLKMADYFAPIDGQRSERHTTSQGPARSRIQPTQAQSSALLDGAHLQQCEKELLDNVAINFLFTKGSGLSEGLIDIDRVYGIVEKIKEIARDQITQGSRDINFEELVEFLQTRDSDFIQLAQKAQRDQTQALSEQEKQARWDKVVGFMRNNPRLLMQMIPDGLGDAATEEVAQAHGAALGQASSMRQADMVLKRSRVYDKIQEAQSWHKLQQLSQNFTQSRGAKHPLRPAQAPRPQHSHRPSSGGLPQQNYKLTKLNRDGKHLKLLPTSSQVHKNSMPMTATAQHKTHERPPKPGVRQPLSIVSKTVSIQSAQDSRRPSKNCEPTGILRKESYQQKRPKINADERYQALKPVLIEQNRAESNQSNDMETLAPLENTSKVSDCDMTSGCPPKSKQASSLVDRVSSARKGRRAKLTSEGRKAHRNTAWVEKENIEEESALRPRKIEPQQRGKSAHQEIRWSQRQADKTENQESLAKPRMKKEPALLNTSAAPNAAPFQDSGVHNSGLPNLQHGKPLQKFIDPNDMRWKLKADQMDQASYSDANFENDQNNDQQGLFSTKNANPRFRLTHRPITAKAGQSESRVPPQGWSEGPGMHQIAGKQRNLKTAITGKLESQEGSRDRPSDQNVHDQFSSNSRSRPQQQRDPSGMQRSLLGNSNMMASNSVSRGQDASRKDSTSSQLKPMSANPPKFIRVKSFGAKRQQSQPKLGGDDTTEPSKNQARKTYYQPCKYNPLISQPISEQLSAGWGQDDGHQNQERHTLGKSEHTQSGAGQSHREGIEGGQGHQDQVNAKKSHRSFTSQEGFKPQTSSRGRDFLPPLQQVGKFPEQMGPSGLPISGDDVENQMYQSKLRSQVRIESQAAEKLATGDGRSHGKSANLFPSSDQQAEQSGKSRSPKPPGAKTRSSKSSPKTRNPGSHNSPKRGSHSPSRSPSRKLANNLPLPKKEQEAGTSTTELQHKQYEKASRQAQKSERSPAKSKKKKVDFDREEGVSGASNMVRCEMSVQTNIRGIEHRILIRPDTFDADPFKEEEAEAESDPGKALADESNLSQADSGHMSGSRSRGGNHYRVPVINWSDSPLYAYFLSHPESPEILEADNSRYTEEEVDQVLQMVKNSYADFQRTDLMKPFYQKAKQTLLYLLKEQTIEPIFDRVQEVYKEVTLENAMKLLIRCKLAFNSRSMVIHMLQRISEYKMLAEQMKALVAVQPGHFVDQETYDEISKLFAQMVEAVSPIMSQAEVLSKSSHRQLKGKSFVFEHKDATALVKVEIGEIRRLVQAFAIADGHQDNSSDNSASQEEEKA